MLKESGGVGMRLEPGTSSLEPDFQHLIWPVSLTTDHLLNSEQYILDHSAYVSSFFNGR